jgi:hypothetical protein
MIIIRVLVIAFNVAIVTFLIYRMFQIGRQPIAAFRKFLVIFAGLILIIAPMGIFVGLLRPNIQYFLIYPVAVSLFLFLIREV